MRLLSSSLITLLVFITLSTFSSAATISQVKTTYITTDKATTGVTSTFYPLGINRTFHGFGSTTNGVGAATIEIQVSNDCSHFIVVDTLSLTLGTSVTSDNFAINDAWKCVRANVASISGTGAKVSLVMGVQL